MHLPDGVLPPSQWVPLAAVASGVVTAASSRARQSLDARRVPVVGFLAAVVLVLQMLNFPLVGSASGHLTGTTLLVFAAGVESAAVAMASVLVLQALLFQDGGLLSLGANYVNMVVVPLLVAMAFLPLARRAQGTPSRLGVVAGIAAWCGSVAGALSCALQLAMAGVAPLGVTVAAMGGGHLLVGAIEGTLTGVAIASLARRQGATGEAPLVPAPRKGSWWFAPVLVLAALAGVLVPIASKRPDVLESVLHRAGRLSSVESR